ncbi:hypothetical protein L1987_06491 [Smallanthus sonchifolius]|uniref:Uncharacterized protein n=1 Tax=Smallanthus sonchifolius TaxID=185202 RepID=A0ACB9JY85_9ASTR|nr:hypothetical protein L1987_06491 [Smallanthus sonchifolius]
MDDHFTLEINSNMERLDNNPNDNGHEFTLLSGNNFTDRHHLRHDGSLPFMPLPDGTDDNQTFNFEDDHQADSFYNPLTHFPTTREDMGKRISGDESLGNSNSPNFRPGVTGENKAKRNHACGGKKRGKSSAAKVEKPRDVVHVRARRGEATDSHSLAERLRREKINRKLRCLQELVPGCYKTMGMSVMLEVTINYIRSLQNQIEFLSMKLTAASMFYDFNSVEMDALDTMKDQANGYEAQVMDTMGGEGYGNLLQFQSTWPL